MRRTEKPTGVDGAKKWTATGTVLGSTYIGEFSGTKEEAYDKAVAAADVSFCHQCSDGCEDPVVEHITLDAADGGDSYQPDPFPSEAAVRAQVEAEIVSWLRLVPVGGTNPLIDGMIKAGLEHAADRIAAGAARQKIVEA